MAGKRLWGLVWPASFAESWLRAPSRWDSSKRPVLVPRTRVTLHTRTGVRVFRGGATCEQGKHVGGGPRRGRVGGVRGQETGDRSALISPCSKGWRGGHPTPFSALTFTGAYDQVVRKGCFSEK